MSNFNRRPKRQTYLAFFIHFAVAVVVVVGGVVVVVVVIESNLSTLQIIFRVVD